MTWYKAEIKGNGYKIDAGAVLSVEKVIHYVFLAENDAKAAQKAKDFAASSIVRSEFWLYDLTPEITVTALPEGDEPTEERFWLAN